MGTHAVVDLHVCRITAAVPKPFYDGSISSKCTGCQAAVWICGQATTAVAAGELRPLCEVCKPARPIEVHGR